MQDNQTKVKPKKKLRKTNFVRITIDEKLQEIIDEAQKDLFLLSTAEIIKVLIARGSKVKKQTNKSDFLKTIKDIQQQNGKLSPKNDYKNSYKESYHKMLGEKHDS